MARSCRSVPAASSRCSTISLRTRSRHHHQARACRSPRAGASCVSLTRGPGLGEAERERAFDRFWRAGTGAGSGLGLAISKRLVSLDGGTIELRAARAGGIDAVVRYP